MRYSRGNSRRACLALAILLIVILVACLAVGLKGAGWP